MSKFLVIIIYLIFISLGLPDSLLGSGWPVMQNYFGVNSSYAGYVSMTISAMTIISALFSAQITSRLKEKWVVIISIGLTVLGLILFSIAKNYWNLFLFAIPYGLGAGSIDASINNFVAIHYSSRVMNFLHCCYGIGSMISPNIMALALKYKSWKEGYRWTAYVQIFILVICIATLPLWNMNKKEDNDEKKEKENEDIKGDKENSKKEIEESNNKIIKIEVHNKNKINNDLENKEKDDGTKETFEQKTMGGNKEDKIDEKEKKDEVMSICRVIKIKGVVFSCLAFYGYCSGEGTCFLWTSSFFKDTKDGLSEEAIASLSTTVFGGLMFGRLLSGLVSEKLGDKKLIRIGLILEIIGIICIGIPVKTYILAIIGFILALIGMGPIYPSIQHLVPIFFGKVASPTIIGLQMASAYVGTTLMPFVFGLIQSKTSMWALPIYVGFFAILNCIFIEIEFYLCKNNNNNDTEKLEENKEIDTKKDINEIQENNEGNNKNKENN